MKINTTSGLLFLSSLCLCSLAQTPLSLEQALQQSRNNPALTALFQGRSDLANSDVTQVASWDNPELTLSTESIDEAGSTARESYLLLSQRFELFGLRRLKTSAAQQQEVAAQLQNQMQQLALDALVEELFFTSLHYQERIAVLQMSLDESARLLDVISAREKAGSASGYDRIRMQRLQAEALGDQAREQAFLARSQAQLKVLLSRSDNFKLAGSLLPEAPPPDLDLTRQLSLQMLDAQLQAGSLLENAAGRWLLPEITLEGGFKQSSFAGTDDTGVYLAARLPLPLLNRNKAAQQRARATVQVARAEKELTQSRVLGAERGLREQILQLTQAARNFEAQVVQPGQQLKTIAQAGYLADSLDILALIDAVQSQRDAQLKLLDKHAEVRQLHLELAKLGGAQ